MTTNIAPAPSYSAGRAVWLVGQREIMVRLRSVAFLVSTGIMMLLLVGAVVASSIFALNAEPSKVAVVSGVSLPADAGFEVVDVADRAAAEALVRDGEVSAALVPDDGTLGFLVLGHTSAPTDVVQALSVMPPVELLEASEGAASSAISWRLASGWCSSSPR